MCPDAAFYTPPAPKPMNQVFFSSDDSLYKSEVRKLAIPKIEIQDEDDNRKQEHPVFELKVTDFSEPSPRDVTESWIQEKEKTAPGILKKLTKPPSLQDLSSSTSSVNSGVHESNLDLSVLDPDTPLKHWKSPDEIRKGHVKELARHFEHVSALKTNRFRDRKYRSEEKLTDFERLELLKLLREWSIQGSESKAELSLRITRKKSVSEPDLSHKSDFWHRCEFKNCIFNEETKNEIRHADSPKKFPRSYIVTRRRNWKSCSDIKCKERIVRKCCKNAKQTCPMYRRSFCGNTPRKTRSCVDVVFVRQDTVRDDFPQFGSCRSKKNCVNVAQNGSFPRVYELFASLPSSFNHF